MLVADMTEEQKNRPESSGGTGELLNHPDHIRADCRFIERYPIAEKYRGPVISKLLGVILQPRNNRELIAAVKALMTVEKRNIDYIKEIREETRGNDPGFVAEDKVGHLIRQMEAMKGHIPGSDQ